MQFFLWYYVLKDPANWLIESILANNSRTRILPDMGLVVIYQQLINKLVSISNYFQEKLMPILFRKMYFGAILDPFCPNLSKTRIWAIF